ncbi:hypothetical protein L226DRAFT_534040 [Lentinus tigrinus ALCF2SS1-7]|uniref:uncharacterized protein n=1 Tax=Lentinus tigrinus ALCF2SS1-7 TaxID=1328758 RepID=UPI001165FAC4|nr:hypothetical protein L226DRAFT_534040 [Lentinus tigrinus ALCF2SS1-7]
MMSRMVVFFFAFLSLLAGSQIYAAPANEIVARQIGNLQCNINRLQIVTGLAGLQGTLKNLASESASDAATAASVQTAQDSVTGAQGAIGVIAKALLTGQTAPAAARDQVAGNLTAAQGALTAINSCSSADVVYFHRSDTTVSATLQKALTQLGDAATAGEGVVSNCK